MTWPDIAIALISAVTGGGLLKVFDTWLNRTKLKNDKAKQQKDEAYREAESLRLQIKDLKLESKESEKEADNWRHQYWAIHNQYETFKMQVARMLMDNGISPSELFKDK